MKYAHKKRLESAKMRLGQAKGLLAENARETHSKNARATMGSVALALVHRAYEDLETILDGSESLVEAILEDRLGEFLENLREDLTDDEDDSDPDPNRGP